MNFDFHREVTVWGLYNSADFCICTGYHYFYWMCSDCLYIIVRYMYCVLFMYVLFFSSLIAFICIVLLCESMFFRILKCFLFKSLSLSYVIVEMGTNGSFQLHLLFSSMFTCSYTVLGYFQLLFRSRTTTFGSYSYLLLRLWGYEGTLFSVCISARSGKDSKALSTEWLAAARCPLWKDTWIDRPWWWTGKHRWRSLYRSFQWFILIFEAMCLYNLYIIPLMLLFNWSYFF